MTFLPIVQRELRVAARRRGTYWNRFGAAIAALGIGAWIMSVGGAREQQIGPTLFVCLAVFIFLYTAVAAQFTCDCLSVEKREGTLGLLFLTDLRGYDVVLGKLAATSLNAFYGLLAVMPVLAIPLLLGAVGMGEFCRVALVAINLLFFFLSVGIFASSVCRQDHRAAGLSAVLVLTLMLGVPGLVYYYVYRHLHVREEISWTLCPAYDCFLAFDDVQRTGRTTFQSNPRFFWLNLRITHAYAWLFLLLACWIVPRSWQDNPARSSSAPGWRDYWRRLTRGSPKNRAAKRRRLLEINPFLWRVAQGRFDGGLVWLFLLAAAVPWWWMRRPFSNGFWDNGADICCAVSVHLVLKFWIASEACRELAQDRRSGSLELLLSTPLTEGQIIRGQLLALSRKFGGPLVAVLVADLMFLAVALRHPGSDEDYRTWIGVYLTAGVFLIADLIAISWLSMWLAVSGRKPNRAAAAAFSAIVLLPAGIFCVGAPLFAMLTHLDVGVTGLLAYWSALGLATDATCTIYARGKLQRHFRETILRGSEPALATPGRRWVLRSQAQPGQTIPGQILE